MNNDNRLATNFVADDGPNTGWKLPFALLFLVFIGFIVGGGADNSQIQEGGLQSISGGLWLRAGTVILAMTIGLMVLTIRGQVFKIISGGSGWIFFYALIALASVAVSPRKLFTFYKASELLCATVIANLVWTTKEPKATVTRLLSAVCFVYVVTALIIWIQYEVFGIKGVSAIIQGTPFVSFMLSSRYPPLAGNAVGFLGAIIVLFSLYCWFTAGTPGRFNRIIAFLSGCLGMVTVVYSYTRSVLFFLFLIVMIYLVMKRKVIVVSLITTLVVGLALIGPVQDKVLEHLRRGNSTQQLVGMSGRVGFWQTILKRDVGDLIIGKGFGTGTLFEGFAGDGRVFGAKLVGARNAHNSFFEVVSGLGLIGGLAWLVMMVRIWILLLAAYRRGYRTRQQFFNGYETDTFVLLLATLSLFRSTMNATFVYFDYFFPLLGIMAVYADVALVQYREREL